MPVAVRDGAETADRTSTSIRHGRTAPMASRPQCSRRRSAFFLSSRFDAREQSERCRLNCTRRAVQTARIVRFEKQFENLRVLRVTVRSAVFSVSDVTSCKRSDGVVAGKDPARIQGTADVRALKGLRSTRHSKGEPPLQKRGLPLAKTSHLGDRVPLRPRKAVKHPGTLGTVHDVRAPRGHDGPPRFEEV